MNNQAFNSSAVRPIDCISEGWNLFSQNPGIFIAIGLLTMLLAGCLGIFGIGWFLYGPLMVGVFYSYLRQTRSEEVEIGNLFSGFQYFLPAMLIGLLILGPSIIARLYDLAFQVAGLLAIYQPNELSAGIVGLIWIISFALKSVILILTVVVNILFLFSFPLMAEHGGGMMDTLKLSAKASWANAGGLFLLMLLNGVIVIAGALMCLVGLIVAIPLVMAANTVAYRMVFPDMSAPQQNMSPPDPGQYAFQ